MTSHHISPMPGYLKLFQLSPRDFAREKGWDVLLIDEAQDLTPAILSILTQTTCAKIFVGDPHQQIYSFRGATNAMPRVRADHTYYLTRVSKAIAVVVLWYHVFSLCSSSNNCETFLRMSTILWQKFAWAPLIIVLATKWGNRKKLKVLYFHHAHAHTHTHFHTHQSFRFGPEIAYVCAQLLRTLKGVKQQTLVGSDEEGLIRSCTLVELSVEFPK